MNLEKLKPNIRYLSEMTEVLFDQVWVKSKPDLKLYFMYRDLAENDKDREKIKKYNLRYDITTMPFIMLGQEYNKTAGHDHSLIPGTNMSYPEIYQVLSGQVIFLIQDSRDNSIKDVYAVKAEKNDKIIIPPNYEHLMINASGQEFKTANWIYRDLDSNIYEPFKEKQGFCYYALIGLDGNILWQKNPNYQNIPELRFLKPNQLLDEFEIDKNKEMYSLIENLDKLDFLKNPQKYEW